MCATILFATLSSVCGYTFLPYGSAKAPSQVPIAALLVRRELCPGVREELERLAGYQLISTQDGIDSCSWSSLDDGCNSGPAAATQDCTLLLVQADRLGDLLALAEQHGARCFRIDAGPFSSAEEAAQLMLRWLDDYWKCKQFEGRNSCFEFGGCHKRCWWRGSIGRVTLKLDTAGTSACAGPESGALADLIVRVADDDTSGVDRTSEVPPLELVGSLVSFGEDAVYCGLRPR